MGKEQVMKEEKITNSQYMFLIVGYLQGCVLILSFMDSTAKQDAWIIIVLSALIAVPIVLAFAYLAKWFPDKNFFGICRLVYGRVAGKIITGLYILFFLIVLSFNIRDLADFYTNFIMPETPGILFMIIFMLVAAYALKKGMASVAKVSLYACVYTFIAIALIFLLLIRNMDFSNFLPMFELPADVFIRATSHFVMVPFCELVFFLMMMPVVKSKEKLGRYTIWAVMIGTVSFIATTIRNTAVLGPSSSTVDFSSYQSVRLINIGEFFTRVELLTALGLTITLFIKVCVLFYASVKGISQFTGMESYTPLLLPVGAIAVILARITYDSTISHFEFALQYNVPLFAPFYAFLPLLTLLVARLRRLNPNKRKINLTECKGKV